MQVHYLVRENLLELDEIRKEQEDVYKELQHCYGLEKCLKEFDLLFAPTSKFFDYFNLPSRDGGFRATQEIEAIF